MSDHLSENASRDLRTTIATALLAGPSSYMGSVAARIEKAHRFRLPLQVAGEGHPGFRMVLELTDKLGIATTVLSADSKNFCTDHMRLPELSPEQGLRIVVPPMQNRESDLCVVFPFYVQYNLARLREHHADLPEPNVSSLYLLHVWARHFQDSLLVIPSNVYSRIYRDVFVFEGMREFKLLGPGDNATDDEMTVQHFSDCLSNRARMYLGFCRGEDSVELLRATKSHNHPINKKTRNKLHAATAGGKGSSHSWNPTWFVREFTWSLSQAGRVAENAAWHNRVSMLRNTKADPRVDECLYFRLEGKTEDETAIALGFADKNVYELWARESRVDIGGAPARNWYEEWKVACEQLGIEPDLALLEPSRTNPPAPEDDDGHEPEIGKGDPAATFAMEGSNGDDEADSYPVSLEDGRILRFRDDELAFTFEQAPLIDLLWSNFQDGNEYISEPALLRWADQVEEKNIRSGRKEKPQCRYSVTSLRNLFRRRWKEFNRACEQHPTEKDLWRMRKD